MGTIDGLFEGSHGGGWGDSSRCTCIIFLTPSELICHLVQRGAGLSMCSSLAEVLTFFKCESEHVQ